MTERQKSILASVQMTLNDSPAPVTEETIIALIAAQESVGFITGAAPLTDVEREEVIKAIQSSQAVRIDKGHCLTGENHKPWYTAAKANNNSYFWDRYRTYLLKEGWDKETINELDRSTDEIMDHIGNPDADEGFLYRGLCIGDVQSGKTSTYIGLINKAADAHYRVIILLTGTIEKLRRQTQQRIDQGFIGLDSYAFTLERDNIQVGVGSIDPNTSGWAVTSTTSDFNAETAKKVVGKLSGISDPVIFVVKKNKSILDKLERWLRSYNADKVTKKINLPMLLIDDEADNASVNTKKDEDDVTAINKAIRKLLVLFEKASYIGFTATPYANIFIDPDSEQEMLDQDLFPSDFIYALEASSEYIGARSIFSENADYSYMLEANDDCEKALPIKHKKDDVLTYIPESLKEAIAAFFIANAVRDLRGETSSHRTMMINISRFIAVQNQITKLIDDYVREAKREIHNYYLMGEEALKFDIFKLLKNTFEKYFSSFTDDPAFSDLKHFSWEEIQKAMYPAIARIEVRSINGGNASKNLDYEDYEKEPDNIGLRLIAIGGLSLSRGLTLEGLSTSYFYRNSSMYDTLMQMGRWFGYRMKYRDLCKIWMPEDSMAWYSYISMATDNLRDEVRRMEDAGMTPKNFGLAVRSDLAGLMVTARNKMRSAKDYELNINFSGVVVETKYLYSNKDILLKNYNATEAFLSDLFEKYTLHHQDPNLALKNYQYLNVDKDCVIEFLKDYTAHPLNIDFSIPDLLNMFSEDAQGIFDVWDVLIASGLKNAKTAEFPGLTVPLVGRGFSFREDTQSLQMSGKNSRLGSKDLAKGGLTVEVVNELEEGIKGEKSVGENFYFKSGIKRNPLLVIYPIKLTSTKNKAIEEDEKKEKIIKSFDFPLIGLSIGIPSIIGKAPETLKYKINKQKYYEIFGVNEDEEIYEQDETIPED